jgi:general secretion pathway protein E
LPLASDDAPTFYRPRGCAQCQSGYRGRIGVFEFLPLSDKIRQFILERVTAQQIHRAGAEEGMCSMYEDGLAKAIQGVTSIEEVLRVTRDPT